MTRTLEINYVIDEMDNLFGELRRSGTDVGVILDALAIYLEIAESLDDPTNIGDLY